MNKTILTGRLAAEPKSITTSTGTSMAVGRLAVQSGKKDADFFDFKCFSTTADFLLKCKKGQLVSIDAHLGIRKVDMANGHSSYVPEVIADRVISESAPPAQSQAAQPPAQSQADSADLDQYDHQMMDDNPFDN